MEIELVRGEWPSVDTELQVLVRGYGNEVMRAVLLVDLRQAAVLVDTTRRRTALCIRGSNKWKKERRRSMKIMCEYDAEIVGCQVV